MLPLKSIYALTGITNPMLNCFHCHSYSKSLLFVSQSVVLKVVPYSSAMKKCWQQIIFYVLSLSLHLFKTPDHYNTVMTDTCVNIGYWRSDTDWNMSVQYKLCIVDKSVIKASWSNSDSQFLLHGMRNYKISTRWWVVIFTLQALYPQRKSPWYTHIDYF